MPYGLIQPVQRRSAEALERLVDASIELVSEGGFDDAPLTNILKKAGCSVGAFYGRFKSKEALFHYLQEQVIAEMDAWLVTEFTRQQAKRDALGETEDASTAARLIVETLYRFYARKAGLFRAIFVHTRLMRDEVLIERIKAANSNAYKLAEGVYSKVATRRSRAESNHRWEFGLRVVAAFVREEVLFAGAIPINGAAEVKNRIADLQQLYLAYVDNTKP